MVHHVDLLGNCFLFGLNYTLKVKIANCRVYKGEIITWNMAAASQENYIIARISLADNVFAPSFRC